MLIDYKNPKTDKSKLFAVYSLIEQMRLEHNRLGATARSDPEKYIKTGKWYLCSLRPERLGGNVFWKQMMPLLQEQNKLRLAIRRAVYDDEAWMALSEEEQETAFKTLFGDRQTLKKQSTEAVYSSLNVLKTVNLDSLGKSEIPDPYEDFTTYTEVDEDGDLTVTATRITVDAMRFDAVSYVRDSKGSGHFGDFEHLVALCFGAFDSPSFIGGWAVTSGQSTLQDMLDNDDGIAMWFWRNAAGQHRIATRDCTNDDNDFWDCSADDYWLTIERAGTTFTCKIYSDASRTTLEDTLSHSCGTDTYQYVFGCYSRDATGSGEAGGYIEYIDLQEGGVKTGSATLSGAGTLAGLGRLLLGAKATASGIGTLIASASLICSTSATLAGTGTFTAAGTVIEGTVCGKATLSGTGSLAALGSYLYLAAATFTGTGSLSARGSVLKFGAATLAGSGTLAAAAICIRLAAATFYATGSLAAAGLITGLTATLLAAQKKGHRLPYVEAKVYDYEQGIKRLTWTRLYEGSEPDNHHGIAFDGQGSMHRIRAAAGNILYRQKVSNPGPSSD